MPVLEFPEERLPLAGLWLSQGSVGYTRTPREISSLCVFTSPVLFLTHPAGSSWMGQGSLPLTVSLRDPGGGQETPPFAAWSSRSLRQGRGGTCRENQHVLLYTLSPFLLSHGPEPATCQCVIAKKLRSSVRSGGKLGWIRVGSSKVCRGPKNRNEGSLAK